MNFENQLELGKGVYTLPDVARLLKLPYQKVHRWVNTYWDGELGQLFEQRYSWETNGSKAVSFHTLIELYVMMLLTESGVPARQILNAHQELAKVYTTPFPFARKSIISNISIGQKKIYFHLNGDTLCLNGTKQLELDFIHEFITRLEFGDDDVANRFWPMGKNNAILVDPKRRFGQPVIGKSNISPDAINSHFKANDPPAYIAAIFGLSEKEVNDAIAFCKAA